MKSHWSIALIATVFAILGPATTAHSALTLPDVLIEKTADVDSVAPGGLITYTLYVKNQNIATANNPYIVDYLPDGVSPVSWTWKIHNRSTDVVLIEFGPTRCVWRTRELEPFIPPPNYEPSFYMPALEWHEIYLTVQVDPSYSLGTIENRALIMTEDPESDYDNNESILITRVTHPTIPAPSAAILTLIGAILTTRLRRYRNL